MHVFVCVYSSIDTTSVSVYCLTYGNFWATAMQVNLISLSWRLKPHHKKKSTPFKKWIAILIHISIYYEALWNKSDPWTRADPRWNSEIWHFSFGAQWPMMGALAKFQDSSLSGPWEFTVAASHQSGETQTQGLWGATGMFALYFAGQHELALSTFQDKKKRPCDCVSITLTLIRRFRGFGLSQSVAFMGFYLFMTFRAQVKQNPVCLQHTV